MKPGFRFDVLARDGDARHGHLATPHGVIETPAFLPVGSLAVVRGLDPADLRGLGAQMLLANAYHLHERPGDEIVARLGGLHGFSGWRGPWLTDSGGYQVTSLADRVQVNEEGVSFRSPWDGSRRLLSPERAMAIQEALGADIAMVLDECLPMATPGSTLRVEAAAERTLRWAERCRRAHGRHDQALFGIVQGGASSALRVRCARALCDLGFDGYALGGLGLGESPELRLELVQETQQRLPTGKPRYLMGLGRPSDLVQGIAAGADLFDCVIPTRHARHGVLFTSEGELRIRNARFRNDEGPIDPDCDCPTCAHHSRAYLRHLLHVGDMLGGRLASLHNLRFYLRLLEDARHAIARGCLSDLVERILQLEQR